MSRIRLVAVAILLSFAAPIWGDEAEDAFNNLYGEDCQRVARTRDTADDVLLGSQLVKAARTPGVKPGLFRAGFLGHRVAHDYADDTVPGGHPHSE